MGVATAGGPVIVSGLCVYPVKSGAGLAAAQWALDERGLVHDREYMVVDADGRFLTQRECPRLALLRPEPGPPLRITTPDGSAAAEPGRPISVRVWEHCGPALDCGDEAAELLSALLARPARLVKLSPDHARTSGRGDAPVGFADGYPLLITTSASLAELNRRLVEPLPMDRFRPNLVIDGCGPFDEDGWGSITVGSVAIDVVKPCARCAITGVDQATGERSGGEPLATLATFRRVDAGVAFGQNAIHRGRGVLRVGDPVSVRAPRR
jgi:uncharacterized protein YcbX